MSHPLVILKYGFPSIKGFTYLSSRNRKCAVLLVSAGHVLDVTEEKDKRITARVVSQMTISNIYDVVIHLGLYRTFVGGTCTCCSGCGGECKHVAALVHYINSHGADSKTSDSRTWGIPSGKSGVTYSFEKTMQELYPRNQVKPSPKSELEASKSAMLKMNCPMAKMLREEAKSVGTVTSTAIVEDIISAVVLKIEDVWLKKVIGDICNVGPGHIAYELSPCLTFHRELCTIIYTLEVEIRDTARLCLQTVEQSNSTLWHEQREIRLSSTLIHRVRTCRKNLEQLPAKLCRKIGSLPNLTYGIRNEPVARAELEAIIKKKVVSVGLVLHPLEPWLCCSPDGIVVDVKTGSCFLLEIKCPVTCKKVGVTDSVGNINVIYLKYDDDGGIILNKTHQYYTQIQVTLAVTGVALCLLYVYSPVRSQIVYVYRDDEFLTPILKRSKHFYYSYYFPFIVERKLSSQASTI